MKINENHVGIKIILIIKIQIRPFSRIYPSPKYNFNVRSFSYYSGISRRFSGFERQVEIR